MASAGLLISPKSNPLIGSGCFNSTRFSPEPILIFLSIHGSPTIPLRVLESDSIASVKLRIQSYKGFFVKSQKLIHEGHELARKNCLVSEYGLSNGDMLHLIILVSDLKSIMVKTICGREFKFRVERNKSVGYIKHQILKKFEGLNEIENHELVSNGEELSDDELVTDICTENEAIIHLLVRKSVKVRTKPVEKDFEVSVVAPDQDKPKPKTPLVEPLIVNPKIKLPSVINRMVESTLNGLENGARPVMSTEGTGGAYFMKDGTGGAYVAVFKPMDEEPMAENNPRGLPLSKNGEGLKKGTKVGEGALREVAAYLLDRPSELGFRSELGFGEELGLGFAGVPATVLVRCGEKIGSLQEFVRNCGSCEDLGPGLFEVKEVHKIAVLDIRLANADRHAGNILLVRKDGDESGFGLVPIDHGYCLPESFEDCTFEWLYWPQSREKFNSETLNYIKSLNVENDIKLLKYYGWDLSAESARVFRISTMLLKKGAERGLSPFEIGNLMCRPTLKRESKIEEIVAEAKEFGFPESGETGFLNSVSQIMDQNLDELFV